MNINQSLVIILVALGAIIGSGFVETTLGFVVSIVLVGIGLTIYEKSQIEDRD